MLHKTMKKWPGLLAAMCTLFQVSCQSKDKNPKRSETKVAVGSAEFGVLLKVIVYVPEPNHATVTLAALLLL